MADNKTLYVIDLRDNFSPKVKKADRNFKKFDDTAKKGASKSGGIGGLASAFPMASLGLAGLVAGAALGAKKVLDLGAAMEQTRVAFGVMFGSTEKGNEMLDLMNEFANVTPFTNDQVIKAGKTLKAFGFDAEAIAPTMKLLGDVAAGTGSEMSEMATVFGKIKGNGRLMGAELDMLIDRGFNPLESMTKRTGKSMLELRKDMSKGLISFSMVQDSFIEATTAGGQFEDMMAKQSKTFGGLTSTIIGKLGALFATGGEGLANALKPILQWTIRFIDMLPKLNLDPLINAFSMWWDSLKLVITPIKEIVNILFPSLLEKTGEGITMMDGFQMAVNGLAVVFRALTIPIRIVEAAFNGFFEFLDNAMEGFQGIGDVIGGLFNLDQSQIARGINQFKSGFGKIGENIGGFVQNEIDAFSDILSTKGKTDGTGIDLAGAMNLNNLTGAGGGAGGAAGAAGGKSSSVSGNVAGVSSGGIKNVSLNIDKLIEQITFSNTTTNDLNSLKEMVTRVMVEAATDATRLV